MYFKLSAFSARISRRKRNAKPQRFLSTTEHTDFHGWGTGARGLAALAAGPAQTFAIINPYGDVDAPWHVGGFHPASEITADIVTATLLHQYTTPPEQPHPTGIRHLYHAKLIPAQ